MSNEAYTYNYCLVDGTSLSAAVGCGVQLTVEYVSTTLSSKKLMIMNMKLATNEEPTIINHGNSY